RRGPSDSMPTLTVVIPAFNSARTVEQAVQAALAQTGVAHEVVVIDDGSTDDTWQVLERFGDHIRKVRQPNAGPASARNHGARPRPASARKRGAGLAASEGLAFLDADDDWDPEKLTRQLAATDEQTGLVYTDCLYFGDSSRVTARQSDGLHLPEGDIFEALLL